MNEIYLPLLTPRLKTSRPILHLTLAFLCLVFGGFAGSVGLAQPRSLEEFDVYVKQAVKDWEVPGLAVAIVKDGEIVFQQGYGVRRLGEQAPVDPGTRFSIGSTTKALTAAAVGMLVDEGKVQWDDPVIDHLPWFQMADPHVTREVTIRDLLTHRAGLGNADSLWYGRDQAPLEILRRLRFVPPQTSMRSHFTYQNIMYAAAGELIATVSGMSWPAFIEARILKPLGMTTSATTLAGLTGSNTATPHDRVDGRIVPIANASVDAVAAAGSIWSSVQDMSKWIRYLLEEDGPSLLKPETKAELFSPQMIVGSDAFYPTAQLTKPHWTTYGLGWFQQDYQGRAVDFHTGSIDGLVAIAGMIRDERLGVYVLANLDHAEVRHALMYTVFDLYGPAGPRRDWSTDLRQFYGKMADQAAERRKNQQASQIPNTHPSQALEAFAGAYENRLYGEVQVTLESGKLRLVLGPGLQADLEHWHYDTFQATWDARWRGTALITFVAATNGQIGELRLGGDRYLKRRAR